VNPSGVFEDQGERLVVGGWGAETVEFDEERGDCLAVAGAVFFADDNGVHEGHRFMIVPRLYAIADMETLARRGIELREFAEGLRAAGVTWIQLRDKAGTPQEVLEAAQVLREVFAGTGCVLIMNDRVDLGALARFDGVHVGQEDLSVGDARRVLKARNQHGGHGGYTEETQREVVGVSTHSEEQVGAADAGEADYVAIGPIFRTGTKMDAEAVVGLAGVRRARELTRKPLVAIGGITRENCRSVVEAGADSVAVIGGMLAAGEMVEQVARDFLRILG